MYTPSTLILSHLAAFAALASAQGDSQYAASVLSAIINVDPSALASASANLESSVLSALAEPTADQNAIISNVGSEISAVIHTIDQFTATADPSLLSSIEAQASAVGLDFVDFDLESDMGQLTAAADGPEETGGAGDVSATDGGLEETSSLVVISAATSTTGADSGEASSLVVISAATSSATSTFDDAANPSSSSDSMTSQADSASASSSSTARSSAQAESSSVAAAVSTSDNIAAAATSLPIAAVGAGLAILAML
jgi:hypothetical protein